MGREVVAVTGWLPDAVGRFSLTGARFTVRLRNQYQWEWSGPVRRMSAKQRREGWMCLDSYATQGCVMGWLRERVDGVHAQITCCVWGDPDSPTLSYGIRATDSGGGVHHLVQDWLDRAEVGDPRLCWSIPEALHAAVMALGKEADRG